MRLQQRAHSGASRDSTHALSPLTTRQVPTFSLWSANAVILLLAHNCFSCVPLFEMTTSNLILQLRRRPHLLLL